MTDTSTSTQPRPPQDYGGGEEWAAPGEDYHVPAELRPYYSTAEPRDAERTGYVQHGASITQTRTREVQRVVSPGNATMPPVVVTETEPVDCLVDISGSSGYRTWLHLIRLEKARQLKRSAELTAAMQARWQRCSVCGERSATVRTSSAVRLDPVTGAKVNLTGCTQ